MSRSLLKFNGGSPDSTRPRFLPGRGQASDPAYEGQRPARASRCTLSCDGILSRLPASRQRPTATPFGRGASVSRCDARSGDGSRSEEHTSELQSHSDLVCRLLLEKKKKKNTIHQ